MADNKTNQRILVVDDEPDVNITLKLALEGEGFDVDTFDNPKLALSSFRPNYYDLLLLDIKMPEMNGFELYEQIKKLDDKVKVCFISAYDVDYTAIEKQFPSLEKDCLIPNNIIRKPIEVSKLIERIELEILT